MAKKPTSNKKASEKTTVKRLANASLEKKKAPSRIFQLKIVLLGSKPPIWRRMLVPAHTTLARFHDMIQTAMGWGGEHLHQFSVNGEFFGPPDGIDLADARDERKSFLDEILTAPKEKMIYEYDFGDGWEHEIVLEKIIEPKPTGKYPFVTEGRGACPPEDCGGINGYYELLEALHDRRDPLHEDATEWLDSSFDPDEYDPAEANSVFHPD